MNEEYCLALISEHGCEDFASSELEKRFKVKSDVNECFVKFNATAEKTAEILYMSQTAKRILKIISDGAFEEIEGIILRVHEDLEKFNLKEILSGKTYRVECERTGNHDFNSVEIEQELSALIKDEIIKQNIKSEVNLNNPDINIYIRLFHTNYVMGIDLAGRDLGKRQYAVFNHPNNIRGTLAFSFLIFSGFEPGKSIADPFSLSGTIPIEAALYESCLSINYYEKNFKITNLNEFQEMKNIMTKLDRKVKPTPSKPEIYSIDASFKNVSAQKKNAKIAGIDKFIEFARKETTDLDLKLFDKKVYLLATRIPEGSKHLSDNKARSIHKYLFENAKNIIQKKGFMSFIIRNPELLEEEIKNFNLEIEKKREVWQGKQKMFFIKIKNK